ncbi:hypothetical protein ARMSODRAFT_307285 [Armillaria solidipes]|uniref:Uncharacterized protein n=1 Tax=Armillaria solidipes TaxID=1076256 RepID=A0A2H3BER7_9AGAR|nr:hypothetical protein ARMSODRAFT_307285 [Armillaria solidipes]
MTSVERIGEAVEGWEWASDSERQQSLKREPTTSQAHTTQEIIGTMDSTHRPDVYAVSYLQPLMGNATNPPPFCRLLYRYEDFDYQHFFREQPSYSSSTFGSSSSCASFSFVSSASLSLFFPVPFSCPVPVPVPVVSHALLFLFHCLRSHCVPVFPCLDPASVYCACCLVPFVLSTTHGSVRHVSHLCMVMLVSLPLRGVPVLTLPFHFVTFDVLVSPSAQST